MECQAGATTFPNDMEADFLLYYSILTSSSNDSPGAQSWGHLMNPSENREGEDVEPGEGYDAASEQVTNVVAEQVDEDASQGFTNAEAEHTNQDDSEHMANEFPLPSNGEAYHEFAQHQLY